MSQGARSSRGYTYIYIMGVQSGHMEGVGLAFQYRNKDMRCTAWRSARVTQQRAERQSPSQKHSRQQNVIRGKKERENTEKQIATPPSLWCHQGTLTLAVPQPRFGDKIFGT